MSRKPAHSIAAIRPHCHLHCCTWVVPQEDYPEALHEPLLKWLRGETDVDIKQGMLRMTKYGIMGSKR